MLQLFENLLSTARKFTARKINMSLSFSIYIPTYVSLASSYSTRALAVIRQPRVKLRGALYSYLSNILNQPFDS